MSPLWHYWFYRHQSLYYRMCLKDIFQEIQKYTEVVTKQFHSHVKISREITLLVGSTIKDIYHVYKKRGCFWGLLTCLLEFIYQEFTALLGVIIYISLERDILIRQIRQTQRKAFTGKKNYIKICPNLLHLGKICTFNKYKKEEVVKL